MNELRFQAVVGQDQVIRPPSDLAIPEGAVDVTVRPAVGVSSLVAPPSSEEEDIDSLRDLLLSIAAQSEALGIELPSDLAENHDHYAHGKPRS